MESCSTYVYVVLSVIVTYGSNTLCNMRRLHKVKGSSKCCILYCVMLLYVYTLTTQLWPQARWLCTWTQHCRWQCTKLENNLSTHKCQQLIESFMFYGFLCWGRTFPTLKATHHNINSGVLSLHHVVYHSKDLKRELGTPIFIDTVADYCNTVAACTTWCKA